MLGYSVCSHNSYIGSQRKWLLSVSRTGETSAGNVARALLGEIEKIKGPCGSKKKEEKSNEKEIVYSFLSSVKQVFLY